jgi:hypothetical protein
MVARRWIAGLGIGVVATAAFFVAPAIHAQNSGNRIVTRQIRPDFGGIGSFTPAAADPKLAAMLARSGLAGSSFRFTPAESREGSSRNVTVAVRARTIRGSQEASAVTVPSIAVAPIAYNLGVSVGWKRFAVAGAVAKVDLGVQPGGREAVDVGVSYTGKGFGGRVKAVADRPLATTPKLIADDPSYSLDVGGSYSLTRNLDVTAGVRYKSEEERLPRLVDNRRDSQAVYVGTAFRF